MKPHLRRGCFVGDEWVFVYKSLTTISFNRSTACARVALTVVSAWTCVDFILHFVSPCYTVIYATLRTLYMTLVTVSSLYL